MALLRNERGQDQLAGVLKSLRQRGLAGTQLFIGDKCLGLLEAVNETFPDARFQRCTVHFYRNVFSVTPRSKMKEVAAMLQAIHAQENKEAAREGSGSGCEASGDEAEGGC